MARPAPERLTLCESESRSRKRIAPGIAAGGTILECGVLARFQSRCADHSQSTRPCDDLERARPTGGARAAVEGTSHQPAPGAWAKTFTNDSRQLLTVGDDRTFCLWDVSSGELRGFHRSEQAGMYTFLRFAADGRTFCAANESGKAEVWQMRVSLPKAAAPAARLAPPSRDQQAAVLQLVKEAFSAEFAKAKKPADKADLARKLLTRASEAADGNEPLCDFGTSTRPGGRLRGRGRLALSGDRHADCHVRRRPVAAGHGWSGIAAACWSGDESGRSGRRGWRGDRRSCWAARGDWDAASKLAVPAAAAARKSKNAELSKSLARLQASWKEAARSAETLRADEATLATNPDDPAANLNVGKHYARLDDWARALPLFAKSADENLQPPGGRRTQSQCRSARASCAGRRPGTTSPVAPAAQGAAALLEPRGGAISATAALPGLEGPAPHQMPQKRIDEIEAAGE